MIRVLAFGAGLGLLAFVVMASAPSSALAHAIVHAGGTAASAHPLGNKKCPAWPNGSGVLSDGDFSAAKDPRDAYRAVADGKSVAPGWRAIPFSLTGVNFAGSQYWNMAGLCSVQLGGSNYGGGIQQALPIGKAKYNLTFLMSADGSCGPTVYNLWIITAAGQTSILWDTSNNHDVQHGRYHKASWRFKVDTNDQTWLQIGTPQPCGPVVAAISLTQY